LKKVKEKISPKTEIIHNKVWDNVNIEIDRSQFYNRRNNNE